MEEDDDDTMHLNWLMMAVQRWLMKASLSVVFSSQPPWAGGWEREVRIEELARGLLRVVE